MRASLCFPTKILDQHLVVLGKTGAGKSSALRHIVEYLLDRNKRVCIIDPKGDWWGLKSSEDGKGAGYPIITFGDFKEPKASDVPINVQSGKHVAELITSGNRPCIIGFRGWMISHMTQFWIDFAGGIFNANSGELFLVGDEFHNFAPKGKIMDPMAGKCLHWSNRLLSEGRGLGIVCLLASQRPQKVHNDTLTSCETLVAMRVIHAADRGAVEDWIKGCGDKEQGREVLNSLAGMARGEAYVWSPEIDFGPKRLAFPMFTTFDSFAPPQLQKRINEKGWADVDLTAVKEKLAAVIEQARADNPRILQQQIAELKRELKKQAATAPSSSLELKTPVLTGAAINAERRQHQKLKKLAEELMKFIVKITADEALVKGGLDVEAVEKATRKAVDEIRQQINARFELQSRLIANYRRQGARLFKDVNEFLESANIPIEVNLSKQEPVKATVVSLRSTPQRGNGSEPGLTPMDRSILTVLAQFNDEGCRAQKLVLLAGYTLNGSTRNSFSKLRTLGYLVGANTETMKISLEGLAGLGAYEPLPLEGSALTNYWLAHRMLTPMDRAILKTLLENPEGMEAEPLCQAAGYTLNGSTRNCFSKLRTAGLLQGRNTEIMRATQELL